MLATKRERIEELAVLGRLMGDPAGRRWVYQMLSECHIWATSFANNPVRMAFLEGERQRGLRLLEEVISANSDMYIQMLKEMNGERPSDHSGGDRRGFGRGEPDPDDTGGDIC